MDSKDQHENEDQRALIFTNTCIAKKDFNPNLNICTVKLAVNKLPIGLLSTEHEHFQRYVAVLIAVYIFSRNAVTFSVPGFIIHIFRFYAMEKVMKFALRSGASQVITATRHDVTFSM